MKHNHMSLPNFKARTSKLEIPKRIYDLYVKLSSLVIRVEDMHPRPNVVGLVGGEQISLATFGLLIM